MTEQSFSGAIKTDELVGRTSELEAIGAATPGPGDSAFRCVIIRAEGGKGKTRLLKAVAGEIERLDRPKDSVVCLPMIDVADSLFHSITSFLETVYNHLKTTLTPGQLQPFTLFAEHLEGYRRDRDGGAAYNRVLQRRREVVNAFKQAYDELTGQTRVVWVLDTLEQLFSMPPEIEELLKYDLGITVTEIGPTTFAWLHDFILSRPANTTVLLAGRPEPSRWATKIDEDLAKIAELNPTSDIDPLVKLTLKDFAYPESLAYIRQLRDELKEREGLALVADYLGDLLEDEPQLVVLHRLTQGNPIRLALYIDLLINGGAYPEPFRTSPSRFEAMSLVQQEALRTNVDQALLTYIARGLGQSLHEVLGYLSVMRRGLDAERLAFLRGGSLDEAASVLERLAELSFVKVRSYEDGSKRYYLHDELYTIYQREFAHDDPAEAERRRDSQQAIFEQLIAFCERERDRVIGELFTLLRQELPEAPEARKVVSRRLRQLRQQRRTLYVEILHYNLYLEPRKAFNTVYLELAEQAFTANDPELNDQLQSEIELFFFGGDERAELNRLQTGLEQPRWERLRFAVLHERITNATRRLIAANRSPAASLFVSTALEHHRALLHQHYGEIGAYYEQPAGLVLRDYFAEEWRAYSDLAKIYAGGKETSAAISSLEGIGHTLEARLHDLPVGQSMLIPGEDRPFHPTYRDRIQNLVAQIYNGVAYGYSTLSAFIEARVAYQRADFILLVTPPKDQVLHATLKNNLSRVMAELGATNVALSLCDDGIEHNERLGLDYRVAMGLNTKALICSRGHRHDQAAHHAARALQIFRQLDEPRGIGLALIQVAEAQQGRASAIREQNQSAFDAATRALFLQAELALAEADQIFSGKYREAVRQLETKLAQGSLYRDWADALDQGPGDDYFERAVVAYDKAIELAREHGYLRQHVSALLDKAALYERRGHFAAAQAGAEAALALTPADHHLTTERPFDAKAAFRDVVIFRELSKLEALHADIAARRAITHEQASPAGPAAWREAFVASLRHRILAMTYLQLFSPSETWLLGINADKLYLLLDRARKHDWQIQRELKPIVNQILKAYHLEQLEPHLGPLSFRWIVTDAFALPDDLDYLRPEQTD